MSQFKTGRFLGSLLWLLFSAALVSLFFLVQRSLAASDGEQGVAAVGLFGFLLPVVFLILFLASSFHRKCATHGKYRVFEASALAGILLCVVGQAASHNRHVWTQISQIRGWPTLEAQPSRIDYACGISPRVPRGAVVGHPHER